MAEEWKNDKETLASPHLHLSHHLCAEIVMIRGKGSTIRSIAAQTGKLKGALHATLSMSSLGEGLA